MVFAIHWHESAMDLHVFPIPIPPPSSHPIPSLWVFPVHRPWAPVSCIQPGLVICFTLDSILVSMLFSQNIPPSPSPTESKSLFCTSVSLFLFCIEGYCYHLFKFHIYALVYCIDVYLSASRLNPETVLRKDTLLLYNPKECRGKKVCPFFLLENSRPLSPWGPLHFLSTCLGNDSQYTPGSFNILRFITVRKCL